MPYLRPTLTALKSSGLSDITSSLPVGGALLPVAIVRYLVYAIAAQTTDVYGLIDYFARNATPFYSVDEYLYAWGALKGVYPIAATAATGTVTMTGIAGTDIPAGTAFNRADGFPYTSAADYVLGSTGALTLVATTLGSAGNCSAGVSFALANSITGVMSTGTATSNFTGGADLETNDAFRTRMLAQYASPAAGGAASDYLTWTLQVPGVTRAWVNPLGIGPGSVVIYPMFDTAEAAYGGFPQGVSGAATAETRYPTASLDLLACANHLYPLRPVTALVVVEAPIPQPINISIAGLTPSSTTIQTGIAAALTELFVNVGTPLNGTVYPSDINAAIESVPSVQHFTLVSPASPVSIALGSLPTLGAVMYS